MISTMKTMFQGWFRAVSTGVCPYHQKSDFLSILNGKKDEFLNRMYKEFQENYSALIEKNRGH
jgi:hypothetical protein